MSLTGDLRPLVGYSEDDTLVLACSGDGGEDPDLWFAHPTDNDGRDLDRAKTLCWSCPIRNGCLERNLDESDGVFGGFDGWERRILREGPALCHRCRCLIPRTRTVCVPCSKTKSKARTRSRAGTKRNKRGVKR